MDTRDPHRRGPAPGGQRGTASLVVELDPEHLAGQTVAQLGSSATLDPEPAVPADLGPVVLDRALCPPVVGEQAAAQQSAAAADADRAREQEEADAIRATANENREQASNLLGDERTDA